MAATHRWLGLGEFPRAPVVDYLARSIAALYGFHGVLLLIVSGDPVKYRTIVWYLAVMNVLFGLMVIGIDLHAGIRASSRSESCSVSRAGRNVPRREFVRCSPSVELLWTSLAQYQADDAGQSRDVATGRRIDHVPRRESLTPPGAALSARPSPARAHS